MAKHYDLEEQEQIATIKHFWQRWGILITSLVVAVVLLYAAFTAYVYWQQRLSSAASVWLDSVTQSIEHKKTENIAAATQMLQADYGKTVQASLGSLLAGKYYADQKLWDQASANLDWVAANSGTEGLRAMAVLRKSAILIEQKKFEEALKVQENFTFPEEFSALHQDRLGDIYLKLGLPKEAVDAYKKSLEQFAQDVQYRAVVESKLNSLGHLS